MKIKKIRITRKQAIILDWIFSAAFLGLAFWADWRIGLAFIAYDISRIFEIFANGGKN